MGTTIYYENINNRRFIDLRRPIGGRPIVDLGFLVDEVSVRTKPLDCAAVMASPSQFTVMATDVQGACRAPLRDFHDGPALLSALRAGATMPVLAGPPVRWRDRDYLDASLTEPIPVPLAEADGHTHLLVLLTRPSELPKPLGALDRWFVLPRLRRLSAPLAELYQARGGPYAALLGDIAEGRGPGRTARVLGVRPGAPAIDKLERSAGRLRAGADSGYRAVMRAFGVQ
jgi:predicted patatin/cPLA2 family phospholipase